MTIRTMTLKAVPLVALLILSGCAQGDAPGVEAAGLEAAQEAAAEANEAVAELEERVAELESDLRSSADEADDVRSELGAKLKDVRERVWASISDLRSSIEGVKGEAASAVSDATSALGQVAAALRELNVLEDRFDYHVNKQHGGG